MVKTFPCYTAEKLHNPKKLHNNIPDLLLGERDDRLSVLAARGAGAARRVGMVVRGLRCYRCYRGCSDTGGKWHCLKAWSPAHNAVEMEDLPKLRCGPIVTFLRSLQPRRAGTGWPPR
jgi:hypothetical protein